MAFPSRSAISAFAAYASSLLYVASAFRLPFPLPLAIRRRPLSMSSTSFRRPDPAYPVSRGAPVSPGFVLTPQGIGDAPAVSSLRLSHILFRSEDLARETLGRLRGSAVGDERDGAGSAGTFLAFDDMARMISACELTREKGGSVGWIDTPASRRGKEATHEEDEDPANAVVDEVLPPEARRAVFEARCKPGDVLRVTSRRGHHLVQIVDVMGDVRALATLKKSRSREPGSGKTTTGTARTALAGTTWEGMDRTIMADSDRRQLYYSLETMGCQMNAADAERMEGQLASLGMLPVAQHPQFAIADAEPDTNAGRRRRRRADPLPDLVLLNTCSIRDHAEQKLYSHLGPHALRKRQGEDVVLVVAGCVAQQEGEALLRRFPEVDLVMGPQYANRLGDLLEAVGSGNQVVATEGLHVMEDATRPRRTSTTCAWVNVIYGCNERCTYCVVPTTRGIEQSRPVESIVQEVRDLVAEGYREVTLLGQNIDAYGRDMLPRRKFSDLLRTVCDVPDLRRVRFVTSHPKYMSLGVVDAVADCPAACDYFHVPFQSGADEVLARMGRGYTRQKFLAIVDRIRQRCPDAAVSADVIVGFPGETEEQFRETLSLMEEVVFDSVNTAAYSPRPNTPAAEWGEQVPEEVKKERLARINVLNKKHAHRRRARMLGRTVEVLVEERNIKRPQQVMGRTTHGYVTYLDGDIEKLRGKMVMVEIDTTHTYYMTGKIVSIEED